MHMPSWQPKDYQHLQGRSVLGLRLFMAKVHPIATQPACRYDGENKTLLDIKTPPLVCGLLWSNALLEIKWTTRFGNFVENNRNGVSFPLTYALLETKWTTRFGFFWRELYKEFRLCRFLCHRILLIARNLCFARTCKITVESRAAQ